MTTRFFRLRLRAPALGALVLGLLPALGAMAPAMAAGDIYLCVDASGRRELTDTNRGGCKALDVPGYITAPAQAQAPRKSGAATRQGAAPAAAPADFPRVDNAQQRARDSDRRDILEDELRSEERKLAELKSEFQGGEPERRGNERNYAKYQERVAALRDSIGRTEQNIASLKREIANIK